MSPDIGRFLQPDPIGFKGDASNLYRYCSNDWGSKADPMGLQGTGGEADATAQDSDTRDDTNSLRNGDCGARLSDASKWDGHNAFYNPPQAHHIDQQATGVWQGGKDLQMGQSTQGPPVFPSWQRAGQAGVENAIPFQQETHKEQYGDIGQSAKNPKEFTYGPPHTGTYGWWKGDKTHPAGWYHQSFITGKADLPKGFNKVGSYFVFARRNTTTWFPGDKHNFWATHQHGVLGIPPRKGETGAQRAVEYRYFEYKQGMPDPGMD